MPKTPIGEVFIDRRESIQDLKRVGKNGFLAVEHNEKRIQSGFLRYSAQLRLLGRLVFFLVKKTLKGFFDGTVVLQLICSSRVLKVKRGFFQS